VRRGRLVARLTLAAVGVLLIAGIAGDVDWAWRVGLGVLVAWFTVRVGVAMFRPLATAERSGPAVDVDASEGLPVYACTGCGTQLLLLRKGNDRPPRHCGEPMTLRVVAERDVDRPDALAYDDDSAAAVEIPDYPPTGY
jgi:hypothetical protein